MGMLVRRPKHRRKQDLRKHRIGVAAAALGIVAGSLLGLSGAHASDPCAAADNPVACENAKPGTPAAVWDIDGIGDPTIQGFATDISVDAGQPIGFKIKTDASAYVIDIYRLGFYGGDGARKVATVTPSATLPQDQSDDDCLTSPATEIFDCGTWAVSATWDVPSDAISGVYIAHLQRSDTGGESQIPFVVRNDASTSKILFQTSDSTWQAYNTYGGADFYQGDVNGRAYQISYNRPILTRGASQGRDYLFANEYPMLRYLERNGYDVSYSTDVDSDRHGNLIKNHDVFMSVGHDEYWSANQRANVEAARDAGTNLAFFSGNEVYWKTRLEDSVDGTNTPNRTITSYKETWSDAKIDPSAQWTGTWRDPRFSPPADGGRPENQLSGTAFMSNSDDMTMQVPAAQGKLRQWRGTTIADLAPGTVGLLAPHTIGYESDEDLDNGFRPTGLIHLSATTGSTPEYLRDFGTVVTPGTTTHNMTLYRAPSGALVFSAGTIQFAWGLDENHDGPRNDADPNMQQFVVNILADMGVQPATLIDGLLPASASTDSQAPVVAITSPAAGATVTNGALSTVHGTATDAGGGQVGGVEVSVDGGTTWHPATGTSSWSYSYYPAGTGTQLIEARAADDSGNITAAPASVQVNTSGPNSLFGARAPAGAPTTDPDAVELGVKIVPQTNGFITGVRFYKGTGNSGPHVGNLWSAGGDNLASGTFSGESDTGWQTLTFESPVAVTAGTTYVASYFAPHGHYSVDPYTFSGSAWKAGPLVAPRSMTAGGNGVFRYGSGGGFPDGSYEDSNYWVDATFTPSGSAPATMVSSTPAADATSVAVSTHPAAVFSAALNAASVSFTLTPDGGSAVNGTTSYDNATKTVTFAPASSLTAAVHYTATVNATDANGNAVNGTWGFTTDTGATVYRLFAADAVPATAAENDPDGVELGVKFVPATNGQVIGVRYYQGAGNTGTHVGNLWSSSGTNLASVTFPDSSTVGWVTALFSTPVPVSAGSTYVASYYAPTGHYASTSNFFGTTWTNGPLSAPSGANGVFRYGSASGFPDGSWQSTNYWVDPLFTSSGGGGDPSPSPTPTPSPGPTLNIFGTATPAVANFDDHSPIDVGVKFTSDVAGTVTGVRFYKGPDNGGTHTGSIWSATGELLATATFTAESDSGWQTVTFTSPVTIVPGTTYVASYHTDVGAYAVTVNDFAATGVTQGPLHVPVGGGAYRYGPGGFPSSPANHNYWVDLNFVAA